MNRLLTMVVAGLLPCGLAGCSYMGSMATQVGYSLQQMAAPEQRVYKHMLDRETVFVFGRIAATSRAEGAATAVVALSDRFARGEVVDVNHGARPDSYYGLNLPFGEYRVLAVRDENRDGWYDESEVVGGRTLALSEKTAPDKVLGGFDLGGDRPAGGVAFRVAVKQEVRRVESLFYPKGSLRALDDPIFSPAMAELGMYEPAAFLEQAPMMFYALEEDAGHKVPVVLVHGIGGSPRDFEPLLNALDRKRFKPWFFYYPTGVDLNQSGAMFYRLFLSGKVIPNGGGPMLVVAHSMGGLVVREAFNHYRGTRDEARVARLITIASPLGGHPAARSGTRAPVVLPSWRDLDPDSQFVAHLHRRPLPDGVRYHLLFAYNNDSAVKFGANSDGVVPLASQLSAAAQREAATQHGYNDSHAGVLRNREAIEEIVRVVGEVEPPLPPDMLAAARRGGYPVELGPDYSPLETYYIRQVGHLLDALASGAVPPELPGQDHFVRAARGEVAPVGEWETGWVKFVRDCRVRRLLAECPGQGPR